MKLREHEAALVTLVILTSCHDAEAPPQASLHPALGKVWKGLDRWFYPEARTEYRETGITQTYTWPGNTRLPDGEIWSASAMTGAHQTLQLPALVWVENLSNGRAVKIRLNDRGPEDGRRILAVTPAVARILGMGKARRPCGSRWSVSKMPLWVMIRRPCPISVLRHPNAASRRKR
ncbi:MAG: RlpA-like double-psi beta-barrel domain-containing protein [Acetobacteraceae bacterium]